ncbi:PIR protein [Plasmodium vivax]|uniref:VIR protein n=1 Tax=Plasmodium vivax TaxID=5855 RepID=A0A565A642_PLAVI|nr:PIR protein [Plasmodium vivax]
MAIVSVIKTKVCNNFEYSDCTDLFNDVIAKASEKIDKLNEAENIDTFLSKCKELGNYLNTYRNDCQKCYKDRDILESLDIENSVGVLLEKPTKYGRCPRNLTSDDEKLIELQYRINNLCEKKHRLKKQITSLGEQCKTNSWCKENSTCKQRCSAYLNFLNNEQSYFLEHKKKILELKSLSPSKISLPDNCDVTDDVTFKNNTGYCDVCNAQEEKTRVIRNGARSISGELVTQAASSSLLVAPIINSHGPDASPSKDVSEGIPDRHTHDSQTSEGAQSHGKLTEHTFSQKGLFSPADQRVEGESCSENPQCLDEFFCLEEESSTQSRPLSGEHTRAEATVSYGTSPHSNYPELNSYHHKHMGYANALSTGYSPNGTTQSSPEFASELIDRVLGSDLESNSDLPPEQGLPQQYKTIIMAGAAFIPFLTLLYKLTPLGRMFSPKKRKKHKEVEEKLQRILVGYKNMDQQNYNLTYGNFGRSLYDDMYSA